MQRFHETITQASRYIGRFGEDLTMLDALKVAYFYTGQVDEAVRYGQRAIELRDAEACRMPAATTMTEPSVRRPGRMSSHFRCGGRRRFTATAP